VVKRATHRRSREAVAVKILRLPPAMASLLPPTTPQPASPGAPPAPLAECPASDLEEEDILKEVLILRDLDSPHVLRLREYFLAPERGVIYLVTELMLGGQLLDALLAQADGVYGERDARAAFTAVRDWLCVWVSLRVFVCVVWGLGVREQWRALTRLRVCAPRRSCCAACTRCTRAASRTETSRHAPTPTHTHTRAHSHIPPTPAL
jgi:hypothetical protein